MCGDKTKNSFETKVLDEYANEYEAPQDIDHLEASYRIRTLLEHTTGESVLEMGLGFGLVTSALSKKFKRMVVVDGSQKVIQRARKKLGQANNVTLVHSLFEEYSPNFQFDVIVMSHILEHVVNPVAILQRAKGWLMPQGKIHILVPHAYSFHRRLGRAMGLIESETDIADTDRKQGHRRVYTFDTISRDIQMAGLTVDLLKGMLIKPLSTHQMSGWSPEILEGLYRLGMELPELCSEIYAVARR